MRIHGSPRRAIVQAQAYIPPTAVSDASAYTTGWSATGYGGALNSNIVLLEGFGAWSIHILATAAGNNELSITMRDENNTGNLSTVIITSTLAGSANYQHLFIGPTGSALAFVAGYAFFTIRNLVPNNGAVTMRLFGRAE